MSWISLILLTGILIALIIISKLLIETNRVISRLSNRIHRSFEHATPVRNDEQLNVLKSLARELNITRNCIRDILHKIEALEIERKLGLLRIARP